MYHFETVKRSFHRMMVNKLFSLKLKWLVTCKCHFKMKFVSNSDFFFRFQEGSRIHTSYSESYSTTSSRYVHKNSPKNWLKIISIFFFKLDSIVEVQLVQPEVQHCQEDIKIVQDLILD